MSQLLSRPAGFQLHFAEWQSPKIMPVFLCHEICVNKASRFIINKNI